MNQNAAVALDTTTEATVAPAKKAGRPVDPNSRYARAKAVYASLTAEGKSRKEILVAIQALGLSEGSSAVYFSNIKKESAA